MLDGVTVAVEVLVISVDVFVVNVDEAAMQVPYLVWQFETAP